MKAQEKWRKVFLPTLYDKFFTGRSNQPFDSDVFAKGSDEFIALLQATIKDVFPRLNMECRIQIERIVFIPL